MSDPFAAYRRAADLAVAYQLQLLHDDGSYGADEGYAPDAFHKQAYSWSVAGRLPEAHRLLTWVRDQRLEPDGQLSGYRGDIYKHAWFIFGAQRLGRFDLSRPAWEYVAAQQAVGGGWPHFAGQPVCRALATCGAGLAAVYCGDLYAAKRAATWALSVIGQQPVPGCFYFQTTLDGELITPEVDAQAALCIDPNLPKQCYWELGLPLQLFCRLYQATGDRTYLDAARHAFNLHFEFAADRFSYVGSGKTALGAALLYLLTGNRQARDAAVGYAEFLLATQYAEGGWRDVETEPDLLLIYIDHAAEFAIWLNEIAATLASGDQRWGVKGAGHD